MDSLGITSVNFSLLIHTEESLDDEPYITADEAQQVYYVLDPTSKDWYMVMHMKPRDLYDMGDENYVAALETTQLVVPINFEYLIPQGDEQIPQLGTLRKVMNMNVI